MNIEITKGKAGRIRASDMRVGEVGLAEEAFDHYLLRAYDCIVDLNDPTYTWKLNCSIFVQVLPPGTELKITL